MLLLHQALQFALLRHFHLVAYFHLLLLFILFLLWFLFVLLFNIIIIIIKFFLQMFIQCISSSTQERQICEDCQCCCFEMPHFADLYFEVFISAQLFKDFELYNCIARYRHINEKLSFNIKIFYYYFWSMCLDCSVSMDVEIQKNCGIFVSNDFSWFMFSRIVFVLQNDVFTHTRVDELT